MNILFLGNSYTFYNDLPGIFQKLADKNSKNIMVFSVTCGGHKLYEFVHNPDKYTQQIDEYINKLKFDTCIIQENSLYPIIEYNLFINGLKSLTDKLKGSVERFVLYETWGRKEGSPNLNELKMTNKEMTYALAYSYKKASQIVNANVSHVGLNFYDVYTNHKEIELYNPDLTHPSYKGTCLAALTHYKTLFGDFPENTEDLSLSEYELAVFKNTVLKGLTV